MEKIVAIRKIKIYVISRISKDAHSWTDSVCNHLDELFEVFKPKDHNPWNMNNELLSKSVFDIDLMAMKKSHLGLMLPEYGNDCAWEAGWYANSEKPLVVFVDGQRQWLRDWMVKGGVDHVITKNYLTFRFLLKDPILKYKNIVLIQQMRELNNALKDIYISHYHNDKGFKKLRQMKAG